jgi:hypothetical protein
MSLRIWTVTIAVGGLALYTLSLLPASEYSPSQAIKGVPQAAGWKVPGMSVRPLLDADPTLFDYPLEQEDWDGSTDDCDPLFPSEQPSIPVPERAPVNVCVRAYPFHSSISLEVLS